MEKKTFVSPLQNEEHEMRMDMYIFREIVHIHPKKFGSVDAEGCETSSPTAQSSNTSSLCLPQVQSVLQDEGEAASELCDVQQHHRTRKVLLSLRPHGDLQR